MLGGVGAAATWSMIFLSYILPLPVVICLMVGGNVWWKSFGGGIVKKNSTGGGGGLGKMCGILNMVER